MALNGFARTGIKHPMIRPARVDWSRSAPKSVTFEDVYFDADNGLAETRTVFLGGVGIPGVWQDRAEIIIGETGFGTGLNFLATWRAWRDSGQAGRLWYLAAEGFPLRPTDIAPLTIAFPELKDLCDRLLAQYPPPEPGLHLLTFDEGHVRLMLALAPIDDALAMFETPVHAWYLDGFAPAKNPEMWSSTVFTQLARLSRPGTRLATFTAAGAVRRGLEGVGFTMEKEAGFGRKRARLVGTFVGRNGTNRNPGRRGREWMQRPAPVDGRVAVIGAGIAGASAAWALRRRNHDVTVIDDPHLPMTSDLPAALMVPRLTAGTGAYDRLQSASFLHALRLYDDILPKRSGRWIGQRGAVSLAYDAQSRSRQAAIKAQRDWPEGLLDILTAEQASLRAGIGLPDAGLWIGGAGVLDTNRVRSDLLANIRRIQSNVAGLRRKSSGWEPLASDGRSLGHFGAVVLAAGPATAALIDDFNAPFRYRRGQVTLLEPGQAPACAVQGQTYLTPAFDYGGERAAMLGATFTDWADPRDLSWARPQLREREHLRRCGRAMIKDLQIGTKANSQSGQDWAGLRVSLPDHMPIAGPVPDEASYISTYDAYRLDAKTEGLGVPPNRDGLFVLSGLGAKGFQIAPVLGEYIAALITNDPIPIEPQIAEAVHPARFVIRALKRGTNPSNQE